MKVNLARIYTRTYDVRIFFLFCHSYRLSGVSFFLATTAGRKQNKHLMLQFNLPLPFPNIFVVEIEDLWRQESTDW
jgi:hypothetical protein